MPQDTHSIRFPPDVWSAIEIAAEHQGVSRAEFVRIGALSYAAYCIARRDDEVTERFDDLWAAARRLRDVYDL